MKKLKIILLIAVGIGISEPVLSTSTTPLAIATSMMSHEDLNTGQVSQKDQNNTGKKIAALKVEGTYSYYLLFQKHKMDKTNPKKSKTENITLPPSCEVSEKEKFSCLKI